MPDTQQTDIEQLKRRYDALKGDRGNWEAHWEECAAYIMPNAVGFVGQRSDGEKRMQLVLDSTGINANELLAAGLHGLATNPASKWFSLRMQDEQLNEIDVVKQYLSEVEKRMWSEIYAPGTKFTTALHETYLSMGCFATAIMFVGQRQNGRLNFESRSLAECVLAENAEGEVDTVYRCYEMTVRQVMQEPEWKPSDKVKGLFAAQKYDDKVKIIHAVYPRSEKERDYSKAQPAPEEMAFASCYFEHDTCHDLYKSGFPEFPFLCPRWAKYPGELYGRGPGMTALPDVKMLQAMMLTAIKALQKNADPPLWLRDDGVLHPQRTVPGGANYWRGNPNDGVMLHPTNIQGLNAAFEAMDALRNRIRTTFFADILQIVTETEMTATEVMQRTQERMRLLGPMVGRLEAELLGPLVTRVFGIMHRLGLLPPAPEEIQDKDFTVEYVSPIATAQKQTEANGLVQVAQIIMQMVGDPKMVAQVMAKRVSPDRVLDYLWDLFNNDPDLLLSDEESAALEQQANAAAAVQAAPPLANAAQQSTAAVRNLAQAGAQDGTDLGQLMSGTLDNIRANPRLLSDLRAAAAANGLPGAAVDGGLPQ
jgi:hypothetical protein